MSFSKISEKHGQLLVTSNTNFALQLFKKLSANADGENIFISPASISLALAMTYLGARNETARQMSEVLGFTEINPHQLHALFLELRQSLTSGGSSIANNLYVQKNFALLQEFVDSAGLRGTITSEEKDTKTANFHLANGGSVKVPMMRKSDYIYCGTSKKLKNVKAVRLPFVGEKVSFVVLLPKHRAGINDLEKYLTVDDIMKYCDVFSMKPREADVHLPRFKLEHSFDLGDTLAKQGMKDLFSDTAADLSGISEAEGLFVSNVMHKTFLEVDGQGCEAGAVTDMSMKMGMGMGMDRLFYFKADHPFLFFIQDDITGTIIFMGKYARPGGEVFYQNNCCVVKLVIECS